MDKLENGTKGIKIPFVPLSVIVLFILLDQLSKIWILKVLKPMEHIVVIPGVLNFTYVENTGAAFGLFKGNTFLLGIVSTSLLLGLVVYMIISRIRSKMLIGTMVLIIAGGFGNVIDRFVRGYVVDFMDLDFPPFKNFPVFNVADIFVTVGAVLLMLYILFSKDDVLQSGKTHE